jgi:hypothetical protein
VEKGEKKKSRKSRGDYVNTCTSTGVLHSLASLLPEFS